MNTIQHFKIPSQQDGLELGVTVVVPSEPIKGIIQISHGMSEYRLRYLPFMEYCSQNGFVCVIHDHRGHGESVKCKKDYGYLYEHGADSIVEDLHQITGYIKKQYPDVPLYLFGHSMGSLAVRVYIKKYDDEIDGLIVCGSPSYNRFAAVGKAEALKAKFFHGEYYRSQWIQKLAFGSNNKKFGDASSKNAWLCTVNEEVQKYDKEERCGYVFTANGFYNLFVLMQQTYSKKGWAVKHKDLPIFFIAGSEDPCIVDETHFKEAQAYLAKVGYHNISSKLYPGKRHEILNEDIKQQVYQDVIDWIHQIH